MTITEEIQVEISDAWEKELREQLMSDCLGQGLAPEHVSALLALVRRFSGEVAKAWGDGYTQGCDDSARAVLGLCEKVSSGATRETLEIVAAGLKKMPR